MQKFDTPAPISAVLDIPAGRIRFIAADRADTTVEVLPADASKGRDVKAAEQTEVAYADGVLRITASTPNSQLFGPSGSLEVTVQLPAGSRIEAKAAGAELRGVGRLGDVAFEGAYRQIKIDEAASVRLTALDGDVEVGRLGGPAEISTATGRHPDRRGGPRHGRAPHPVRRHLGRRRRRCLGRPGRRHRLRPRQQLLRKNDGTAELTSAPPPPAATSPPAASESKPGTDRARTAIEIRSVAEDAASDTRAAIHVQ